MEDLHVNVWLDETEIRVGESIPERISEGIRICDAFCFVISEHSVNSRWAKRELNSYIPKLVEKDAFIIPCRVDNAEVPQLLSDYKYADFRQSYSEGFQQIANAVALREEIQKNLVIEYAAKKLLATYSKDEIISNIERLFKDGISVMYFGPNRHFEVPLFVQQLGSLLDDYSDAREIILRFTCKKKFLDVLERLTDPHSKDSDDSPYE